MAAEEGIESLIRVLVEDTCPVALILENIKQAIATDGCMQEVREAIRVRQWKWFLQDSRNFSVEERNIREALWRCRDELCESLEGIVLWGDKIVMPRSLWTKVVDLAHQGHQGVEKTKARIRTKVWFPGVDQMVEAKVKGCQACLVAGGDPPVPPVATEAPAERPWDQVSLDFGSFADGRQTLVVVDSYSKYPLVEVMESTSFEAVKPVLTKMFAMFGLPGTIRTDNGPPFQEGAFEQFLRARGIHHRKITPQWPQANGEVERFMRTLNKALRVAITRQEELETALQEFLMAYRNTPHCTTKCAPSELIMPKAGRDIIPVDPSWEAPLLDGVAAQERRRQTNDKASLKRRAREVDLGPGTWVVVKNRRPGGKFST